MKKLLSKTPVSKRTIKNRVKFHPIAAVAMIIISGSIGLWVLKASFAATPGVINIQILDITNGTYKGIANLDVKVLTVQDTPGCSNTTAKTNSSGTAVFTGCITGTYYAQYQEGYYNYAPNTPYTIGQYILVDGNSTNNAAFYMVAGSSDSDHDGVVDAYDNCRDTAGPANNGGCPVPASTTPTNDSPPANTNPAPAAKPQAKPTTPAPAVVKATSGDTTAPTKPIGFTASLSKDKKSVNLTWIAATDNVGVTSYLIERSTDASTWSSISQSSAITNLTDSSLPANADFYYYRLRAQDAAGNQSEAAFADVENSAVLGTEQQATVTTTSPSVTPLSKKNNLPKILEAVGGATLVLSALGGGVMWYRWRSAQYGPSVSVSIPSSSMPTGTGIAPHETKSLKEMVMENYHPPDQNGTPPTPGSPPTQAG